MSALSFTDLIKLFFVITSPWRNKLECFTRVKNINYPSLIFVGKTTLGAPHVKGPFRTTRKDMAYEKMFGSFKRSSLFCQGVDFKVKSFITAGPG
jgi:hypothetical protein